MDFHFECTKCGKCCHDLKLTLCVEEAIPWAERGHSVQMLVQAHPWLSDPEPSDDHAKYIHNRTFPAMSGHVPVRIDIVLVSGYQGPCPHLQTDMSCGQYEQRPRICRIYPLPSRPFVDLEISKRSCPTEAWHSNLPVLMTEGRVADDEKAQNLADHRRALIDDVPTLQTASSLLGVSRAAFPNEGFAVVTPHSATLALALRAALLENATYSVPRQWTYVTNLKSTQVTLDAAGCKVELVPAGLDYLGAFPNEP